MTAPKPRPTSLLLPMGPGPKAPAKARPRPGSEPPPAALPEGPPESPAEGPPAALSESSPAASLESPPGPRAGEASSGEAALVPHGNGLSPEAARGRRVVALYLPDLPCELAALPRESSLGVAGALLHDVPLAVVLAGPSDEVGPTSVLHGVTARARRLGVSAGQTVAAARALVGNLDVRRVSPEAVSAALARFAESALAYGPVVEVRSPDTVLLDITGCAHLAGGEEGLLAELCERVRQLGHRVRGAVASGPVTARAVARFGSMPQSVVPPGFETASLSPLPLRALPLDDESLRWFLRVGVLTIGDLTRQPRASVASRLYPPPPPAARAGRAGPKGKRGDEGGPFAARAAEVLSLLSGQDRAPLTPYVAPRVLAEEVEWDDAVSGTEPLLLALRGLIARLSARLEGRGEACSRLEMKLDLDPSIARLAGHDPRLAVGFELPVPLSHAPDLLQVVRTKVEALPLPAPVRRAELLASRLERAPSVQLDLSRDKAPSPDALPLLLAELSAELGEGRVGVLSLQNSHIPESRGRLAPAHPNRPQPASRARSKARRPLPDPLAGWPEGAPPPPARLLDVPVAIQGRVARGGFVTIENTPFTVLEVVFAERLDDIGWWTGSPQSRDYAFVWLSGEEGTEEAWVMRDRRRRKMFLHGWFG